jgi:hypothetical protein
LSPPFGAGGGELALAATLALVAFGLSLVIDGRRLRELPAASRRRGARALLLALACGALFLLAARPPHRATPRGGEVLLLTTGASPRDLAGAARAGVPAWAVPPAAGEPGMPAGARLLPDAATLLRTDPGTRALRVAGHGLAPWELVELPVPLHAAPPPPLPFGVARVTWPRRIALGETLTVGGTVAGVGRSGGVARLSGAAAGASSAALAPGESPFELRATPRGAGHHLLELRVEAPGVPPRIETVDVEVVRHPQPALLWLEQAPSAEGREVKRWLAEAGGAFAWRAQLSRGISRDDAVGVPPLPRGALSLATLSRFDLVVADPRALGALGAGERQALATAVREEGVGLLLRAGDSSAPAALGVAFPVRPLPGGGELAARLEWGNDRSAPLALPAREMVASASLVPVTTDRAGRLLAAWQPFGAGALGASLVDGTWRWVLEGLAADHRRYWREAIAALARPTAASPRWTVPSGPLLVGLPAELTLASKELPRGRLVAASGAALELGPRGDADEAERWSVTFWPRESGWHRIGDGDAAAWFHVAPAERWTTWRLAARHDATAARELAPPSLPLGRTTRPPPQPIPLPRWPFFLVLLLALGVLWADEQLGRFDRRASSP